VAGESAVRGPAGFLSSRLSPSFIERDLDTVIAGKLSYTFLLYGSGISNSDRTLLTEFPGFRLRKPPAA